VKHSQVVEEARNYLWHQTRTWLVEPEITLPIGRRVDLMAWARRPPAGQRTGRRFMIIEAKASLSDFYSDHGKMLQQLPWCHLFVYAVPRSLADRVRARMESMNYSGCGLLVVPDRRETGSWKQRRMVIKPESHNMEPKHYLRMLEAWAYALRGKLVGTRFETDMLDAKLKARGQSIDRLHAEIKDLADVLARARQAQGIWIWGDSWSKSPLEY
jgi:hypothetical protein